MFSSISAISFSIQAISFAPSLAAMISEQEVILLLAERGPGPASIRTVEVTDETALSGLRPGAPAARAHLHDSEKWTKYYLNTESIETLRLVRGDGRLAPLGQWAEVRMGRSLRAQFILLPHEFRRPEAWA